MKINYPHFTHVYFKKFIFYLLVTSQTEFSVGNLRKEQREKYEYAESSAGKTQICKLDNGQMGKM